MVAALVDHITARFSDMHSLGMTFKSNLNSSEVRLAEVLSRKKAARALVLPERDSDVLKGSSGLGVTGGPASGAAVGLWEPDVETTRACAAVSEHEHIMHMIPHAPVRIKRRAC